MEQVAILKSSARTACKFCDSLLTVRLGFTHARKQRYLCHSCRRTFVNNGAPPGMKYASSVIVSALCQFYEGASLHWIRRSLMLQHGVQPDHANIRRWIARYTRQAVMALGGVRPHVGDQWVVHETRVTTHTPGSKPVWLWDLMDTETRFLLATGFSVKRSALDFNALLDLATRRANAWPTVVLADVLLPEIESAQNRFEVRPSTNMVRRVLGILRDRNPVVQRLVSRNAAHLVVSGWAVHYNFFGAHPDLGAKTPAEAAGVESPLKTWANVVAI